jgi:hypothetical protein
MIIGFTGAAGAGKSTAAQYLVERYGARRFSFATPLKEMAKMIYGLSDAQVYGTQEQKETIDPRHGKSPRELLQFLGTDVCRKWLGPDVWATAALRGLNLLDLNVCDDVRFDNEAAMIRERGGVVIGLSTTDAPVTAHCDHPSERGVSAAFVRFQIVSEYGDVKGLQRRLGHAIDLIRETGGRL